MKKYGENLFFSILFHIFARKAIMGKKITIEEKINKIKKIHKDKYDLSKTNLNAKMHDKNIVICPIHGEFSITLGNFIYHKQGCSKCAKEKDLIPLEQIQQECSEKYGNIYEYDWSCYKNKHTKIPITCSEHGFFYMDMFHHLTCVQGCPKCGREKANNKLRDSFDDFCAKAHKVHGETFVYDETTYKYNKDKIKITCKKCGHTFEQLPRRHLDGDGCPICNKNISKLENNLEYFFKNNNIEYIPQWTTSYLKEKRVPKTIDFYLPKYNIAIECQGIQHFCQVHYFRDKLDYTVNNDMFKFNKCTENNVKVLYYLPKKFYKKITESNPFKNTIYSQNNIFWSIDKLKELLI